MRKLLSIFLIAAAAGCSSATAPVVSQQKLVDAGAVIEIQYVNFAWAKTYRGFTIDGSGQVFSWDRHGEDWKISDPLHPTVAELAAKYTDRTAVKSLDAGTTGDLFALAMKASDGSLSQPVHRCADAGEYTITAYLPDDGGKLQSVLIRQEGDVAQINLSQPAKDLASRIDNLGLMQRGACRYDQ